MERRHLAVARRLEAVIPQVTHIGPNPETSRPWIVATRPSALSINRCPVASFPRFAAKQGNLTVFFARIVATFARLVMKWANETISFPKIAAKWANETISFPKLAAKRANFMTIFANFVVSFAKIAMIFAHFAAKFPNIKPAVQNEIARNLLFQANLHHIWPLCPIFNTV